MINISGGESDALKTDYVVPVTPKPYVSGTYWEDTSTGTSTITAHLCGSWCNHNSSGNYYWWSTYPYKEYIYLYQIICPKRGCKQENWLQLDTITPCINCGSKLKAVSEVVDFEIPVKKGK